MSKHCVYCGNVYRAVSVFSHGGHLRHCKVYQQLREQEKTFLDTGEAYTSDFSQIIDFDDVLPFVVEACDIYLQRQRTSISKELLDTINLGEVRMLDGSYQKPSLEIYLRIAGFVAKVTVLSEGEEASDLCTLMKYCSYLNKKEIPLPAKFVTIRDKLLSSLSFICYPML